jgi:tetratricopeptide (TPR) repeat protein/transcriptional regulator with XRE-family HTH domain
MSDEGLDETRSQPDEVAAGAAADLGALLRTWRAQALLTQEELATRAGLNVRTIRRLESGRLRRPRSMSVRLLVDALGLDRAEAEILASAATGTPRRTTRSTRPAADSPPAVVPRQLPAKVAGFTGRDAQLRRLDGLLSADPDDETTAMAVAAIAGPAGVGKTSLAVHWAHRVAHHFPDGQLYVDLRGFDPGGSAVHPAEALLGFLTAHGVAPDRVPAGTEERSALYRSRLAGRRVLVLLDNARDADQVRPLLPGGGTCMVLVTSRTPLSGLIVTDGAYPVIVDVLTNAEAHQMLSHRLGPRRTAAEPEAVAEIIARCARLPLALAVVAARAAIRPGFPLTRFAAELRETRGGLDALSGRDARIDLRSVFSWSTRALSPAAARLFRLLGTHPGPDTGTAAAASLAALPLSQVRALLTELADAYLVIEQSPDRYTCHDLLRAHATEVAREHDTGPDRDASTQRLLDHYLHTAFAAARLFNPQRTEVLPGPPRAGVRPEEITDYTAATEWFTAEHRVLLAVIEHAAHDGFDRHASQLAWALSGFLDRFGHWEDWIRCQHTALAAAGRLGDPGLEADAHRNLGRANSRLGRVDDGYAHYGRALELYEQVKDLGGQARTHTNLALLLEQTRSYPEALNHALQSLCIHRGLGDNGVGHANALNTVGWCYALVGDYQQALTYCEEAIARHREIDDRDGEAATWDTLGYAHHHLGDHRQATACYQSAIRLYRELGDRYYESVSLIHLGDLDDLAGDPHTARSNWQRAEHILSELGHPAADEVQERLLGKATATPPATTR